MEEPAGNAGIGPAAGIANIFEPYPGLGDSILMTTFVPEPPTL
jgi:hypothetical protein